MFGVILLCMAEFEEPKACYEAIYSRKKETGQFP